jgi:hypothetical protein
VTYQPEPGPAAEWYPRAGVERALAERVRLPVQERRRGFTVVEKSLALLVHRKDHVMAFTDGATTWYGCGGAPVRRASQDPAPC